MGNHHRFRYPDRLAGVLPFVLLVRQLTMSTRQKIIRPTIEIAGDGEERD